jgi:hypothetical protein
MAEDEDNLDLAKMLAKYAPPPESIDVKYSDEMKKLCQELTVKVREAIDLKKRLTELHTRINRISYGELPDLFNRLEIQTISVGNGIELRLEPYYKANLSVKMDPEKRKEGLEYLRSHAPELLQVEVKLNFAAHEYESAELAEQFLRDAGLDPSITEGVHHARLTSWVKEQFLAGKEIPLETLNAKIGSYVAFAKVDEDYQQALDKLKKMRQDEDAIPI